MPSSAAARKEYIDTDAPLSISRQAVLLDIARSSVYKQAAPPSEKTLALQNAVDIVYTDYPFYGQRRIVQELKRSHDIFVGREAVRTAMRTLGIQALYPAPKTSTPHPEHTIYPYLLRNMAATHPNHIWSTDITYIRLTTGFCYLVALIDWYSRKVLSWNLSNSLETSFCTAALNEALASATPEIHNSDQGCQFTSNDYVSVLKNRDIKISMDGRGRCLDNIFVERLWRSVKYEDVYLKGYETIEEVRAGLTEYFIFYNTNRVHQSLGYCVPDEWYYQNTN